MTIVSEETDRTWKTAAGARGAGPSVTGAHWGGDAHGDGRWSAGEAVEAHLVFDAPVTVGTDGGTPSVALVIAGARVAARW